MHSINVICLQETWLRPNSNPKLQNFYLAANKERETTKGGGVAIFLSNFLPCSEINIRSKLEICATRVHCSPSPISIINLYIPPNLTNTDIQVELNQILPQVPEPYLICGDLNGHHPLWGSAYANTRGTKIYEWLQDNDLITLNTQTPTFETPNATYTHIDITATSQNLALDFEWSTHHDNYTVDHFPILITSNSHTSIKMTKTPRYILSKSNWEHFNKLLKIPKAPFSNPYETCNLLERNIKYAADKSIKKTKENFNIKFNKYWWDESCQLASDEKKKAWKTYRRNLGNIDLWIDYRHKKAILRNKITQRKRNSLKEFTNCLNTEMSSREAWGKINSLRRPNKPRSIVLKVPDPLNPCQNCPQTANCFHNFKFLHSPEDVSNKLAEEFSRRGQNPTNPTNFSNIPPIITSTPLDAINNYNRKFELQELIRAITSSRSNTPGPDDIPHELFKKMNNCHIQDLLEVLNFFWIKGIPPQWTHSYIIPIHKPNKSPNITTSYRPIALTNALCKITERIVNYRLRKYLECYNLLDQYQSGF